MTSPENQRRIEGPTPNGGAYSIGYFSYRGTPCPQEYADSVEIVEYDGEGAMIMRTYGRLAPTKPPPRDPSPRPEE